MSICYCMEIYLYNFVPQIFKNVLKLKVANFTHNRKVVGSNLIQY